MENWQAALIGLVEGLTEFLPVSSTGHLLIVEHLMGFGESSAAKAYAIFVQAGAIAAVLGLYRARVGQMWSGLRGKNPEGARLARSIAVAFVPAAVVGLTFEEHIEEHLFGPWPIVAAWFVGGVLILLVGRFHGPRAPGSGLDALSTRGALIIGLWQCMALWPGTSRSLVTIVGALVIGLSLSAAVEFSFLLGVVTLFAATAWQALSDGREMLEAFGPVPMLIGCASAYFSARLAVRWMVTWLQSHSLAVFGWYRVALGLVVGGALLSGWMTS